MKRKNVLYIISDIDKSLAFEWTSERLVDYGYDFKVILLNRQDSSFEQFLRKKGMFAGRLAYKRGIHLFATIWKLQRMIRGLSPDIVHTHLRYASLLGITAARIAGTSIRIHTRHNSTYHLVYHPHAVYTDKWVSWLSTHIVSISDVVTQTLVKREGTPSNKVVKIHHGFDLEVFKHVASERIDYLKRKYNIPERVQIVGIISRYIKWKGSVFAIEAFKKHLLSNPNTYLILANAKGPDTEEIKDYLSTNLPSHSYTEIEFEEDIAALYQLFDIFIHVPIDNHSEAFGQTYVEALAAGVPSIFTLSGVAHEFIEHEKNAIVVPYKDSQTICDAIARLIEDRDLSKQLTEKGKKDVEQFALNNQIGRLIALYD